MPWFKVDDGFPEHDKLEEIEDDYVLHALCVAAWTLLGADCARRRTGGFVSESRVLKVLAFWPAKARDKATAALVKPLKLWEPAPGGWQFHDWNDYQPSAEELAEEKNLKTERQRRYRKKQREERLQRLRVDALASTPASTPASPEVSGAGARAYARSPSPLPSPLPSLASLESENALAAAESLIRREFARRFEAAEGSLWTRSGDPAVATLARWACSVACGPQAAVQRLLDGFFADEWCRSRHFDVRHLANYAQKYFEPRSAPSNTNARVYSPYMLAALEDGETQ